MLTGPEFATQKLMKKLGLTKQDIDLWELNEAFAAVVLRWVQALDLDMDEGQRQWRLDRDGPPASAPPAR